MQAAIDGLSKSSLLEETNKKDLLMLFKENFDKDPSLDNLKTFLAICKAHRSSTKLSLSLFHSTETKSFSAFKAALPQELKVQMFPEKPWFNLWGKHIKK